MMTILKVILQKFPEKKSEIGQKLMQYLLHDCLFEAPNGKSSGGIN